MQSNIPCISSLWLLAVWAVPSSPRLSELFYWLLSGGFSPVLSFFIYSWRFKGNLPTDLRSLSAVFFPHILYPANPSCLGLSFLNSLALIHWSTRLSLSNIGTGEGLTSLVSFFLGIITLCCLKTIFIWFHIFYLIFQKFKEKD